MRRVVFNQKGGVGKTSIVCNLAAISASRGKRTLVIDLDEQANSTQYLLGDAANGIDNTAAEFFDQSLAFGVFDEQAPTSDYVHSTPYKKLDILPASPRLGEIQSRLEGRYKIYKLREALDTLKGYDAIYIDTPPALNFYTRSALIAADRCLIPFDCDSFSRRALYALIANAREIKADHNPKLEVEGIIVNQFQPRANLPKRLIAELIDEGLPVLTTYLSASVRIRESHERSKPMIFLEKNHKVSKELVALYERLHKR